MKTIYYFIETNAFNEVAVTDGKKIYLCPFNSNGIDVISGVDLYATDTIEKLKKTYPTIDGLYNMDDIKRDFSDEIYNINDIKYDKCIKIIEIE